MVLVKITPKAKTTNEVSPLAGVVPIFPDLKSDDQISIRIVMVGNYLKDNGKFGEEVGAYVDIDLLP